MCTKLVEKRRLYKLKFAERLRDVQETSVYKTCLQTLHLLDYDLKIARPEDKEQLLEAVSYSYSYFGKNPLGEIFHSSPVDIKILFSNKCDHIIKTGTMIVLQNKQNGKIIACAGYLDYFDNKYSNTNSQQLPMREKHKIEVINMDKKVLYEQHHKYINEFVALRSNIDKTQNIEQYYGQWCIPTFFIVLPEFRRKYIGGFLHIIMTDISHSLGYKYRFTDSVNPRSIHNLLQSPNEEIIARAPLMIDYILKDGTRVEQYLQDLENKWHYSKDHVAKCSKLRRNYFVAAMTTMPDVEQRLNSLLNKVDNKFRLLSKI